MLNLCLSLFQYKFTSIFSNTYFSIPYNPLSILLNLFLSLSQSQYTSIFFKFSISPFLPHSILHLSTSIFFYLFVNLTSRLSFSIFNSLSHTMLNLSTWIFFYVFVNLNSRLSFSISLFLSHSILHLPTSIFFYLFVNLTSGLSSSISPFLSHSILYLSTSIFFYLLADLVDAYLSLLQILNSLSISHYLSLKKRRSAHYWDMLYYFSVRVIIFYGQWSNSLPLCKMDTILFRTALFISW